MIDLDRFWKNDALAHRNRCFYEQAPQVALGIRMSDECVFAELGEEGQPWGYTPPGRRIELNKRYNEKAVKIVGIPLLRETLPEKDERIPSLRPIGELFGGKYVFDGQTTWLKGSISTPEQLEKVLDDLDKLDFESFVIPPTYEAEKKRVFEKYGHKPPVWRGVRGPVTLASSVYGFENLVFLYYDAPELFERFSKSILDVILKYVALADREAGYTHENAPKHFAFYDDDCALMTPEMYEQFGYPVLKGVFDYCAQGEGASRYQHSDSSMEHLLPILSRLDLTGCNFGPTVTVTDIRRYLPNATIDGQIAPFTFMNNDRKAIRAEVKRDCEQIKATGTKGLNLTTAGSINNGSLLTSMLTVMEAIEEFGRY